MMKMIRYRRFDCLFRGVFNCYQQGERKNQNYFEVEVSQETDDKNNHKNWKEGTKINLEKSLKVGDEIGGHFVYGHVDCLGELFDISEDEENSNIYTVKYPKKFSRFIVEKGSIAMDGISLTVNDVSDSENLYLFS